MANLKIDELNTLEAFDYSEFIENYFEPMQISKKQKEKRKEAAKELLDIILYFLIWCEEFPDKVLSEEVQDVFVNEYKEVIFQYAEPDEYLNNYAPLFIANLIKATLDHKGEEYFTSVERAAFNAVGESNTIFNHSDLEKAKLLGFKKKRWVAEVDDRTRIDHLTMNGETIPIDDYFVFDDCVGLFPHDYTNLTPRQLANCRCCLEFV